MLVMNAIARGRNAASSESLRAVLVGPPAVHGSEASAIDPISPVAGHSSTLCGLGDPDRSGRRRPADRPYTSQHALSKPFLKNREKAG
jgi:hypothetical protein